MKPMRHFFLSLSMLALAATLTACGRDAETPTSTENPHAPRPVATATPSAGGTSSAGPSAEPAAPAEPFVLVFLGDSLTSGEGLPEEAALPAQVQLFLNADDANVDVRNAGLPGDTSAQAAARFDWSVVPDADGVVIEVGVNDLLRRRPVAALEESLSSAIEAAQARGLWVGLVGMKAPLDADPDYREAFDAVFPDLADAYGIELYSYYFEGLIDPETGDSRPELFLPDGLHPTDAGTSIVAEGMAEWLEDTLPPEAVR